MPLHSNHMSTRRYPLTLLVCTLGVLFIGNIHLAAQTKASTHRVFGAVGALYSLGSIRYISNFGKNNLELGLLASRTVGATWTIGTGTFTYTSFGAGIYPLTPYSPGFFAAVGVRWSILWGLSLRAELNASSYFNGYSKGDVLVGASFNY